MKITIDKDRCTGCLLCEVTCSLINTGSVQRQASAIQVVLRDLSSSIHEPVVCRQCKKMKCLRPEERDFDEQERKKFIWNDLERVENCPFNAIFVFNNTIYHCNLCGGYPECEKSCPTKAIIFECNGEETNLSRTQD